MLKKTWQKNCNKARTEGLENVSLPTTTVTANHTVADGEHTIVYDGASLV